MFRPTYVLNTKRFDELVERAGYASHAAFRAKTGISKTTFYAAYNGERELKASTIRYFLDAFPETNFEYLFYATRQRERVAA